MDNKKNLLQTLSDIGQEMEKSQLEYEAKNDTWWNELSEEEREDAFYAVIKRLHKAEVKDKGSYRHALYDVFGFDGGMYAQGMECGYMEIHNIIGQGLDYAAIRNVNRVEVIDHTDTNDYGRAYTKYLKDDERLRYQLQDDDKTLKLFLDKVEKINLVKSNNS